MGVCSSSACSTFWQQAEIELKKFTVALGFEGDYDWWYRAERTELPLDAGIGSAFSVNDNKFRHERAHPNYLMKSVVLESDSN